MRGEASHSVMELTFSAWLCSLAVIERLRLRRLTWGDKRHQAAMLKEFGCFDLIVGADVVYVEEAVPLLLASIAALLKREPLVRFVIPINYMH